MNQDERRVLVDWYFEQAFEVDRCYALQRMSAWVKEAQP